MTDSMPDSCRVTLSANSTVGYNYIELGGSTPEATDGRLMSMQSAMQCAPSPLMIPSGRFYASGVETPMQKVTTLESCPSRQESAVSHVTSTPQERLIKTLKLSPLTPSSTHALSPRSIRTSDIPAMLPPVQTFLRNSARAQWALTGEPASHGFSSGAPGSPANITPRHGFAKRGVTTALKEELICPICLDAYRLPITVPCGHTFCRYCISQGGLYREACPLCRTALGKTLSINMVLHNLIKAIGPEKHSPTSTSMCGELGRKRKSTSSSLPRDVESLVDLTWWNQNVGKSTVPLQIFLRALMTELKGDITSLFFDDLLSCVTDYFDRNNMWTPVRLLLDYGAAQDFIRSLRVGGIHESAQILDAIQKWVETYVEAKPHTIAINNSLQPQFPNLNLRIFADKLHRVENRIFEGNQLLHKIPWTGGRHTCSVLRLPHSSVSLFHFMLVPLGNVGVPEDGIGLGLMDIGSTLGTMIKLNQESQLFDGDVIHLADHMELDITVVDWQTSAMYYLTAGTEGRFTNCNDVKAWDVKQNCIATVPFAAVFGFPWEAKMPIEVTDWRLDPKQFIPIPLLHIRLKRRSCGINTTTHSVQQSIASNADTSLNTINLRPSEMLEDGLETPTLWVDPSGSTVGRGPTLTAPVSRKIIVTENNGSVSREHCLIYYSRRDGEPPCWRVDDRSSLGTYRKLRPYTDIVPLKYGSVFKVGQCKMEVTEERLSVQNQNSSSMTSRAGILPAHTPHNFHVSPSAFRTTPQTPHNRHSFYWDPVSGSLPAFIPSNVTTARFNHDNSSDRLRYHCPPPFSRSSTRPGATTITRHSIPPRRLDGATSAGLGDRFSTTDAGDEGGRTTVSRSARERHAEMPSSGTLRMRGQFTEVATRTRSPGTRIGSAGPSMDAPRVQNHRTPDSALHYSRSLYDLTTTNRETAGSPSRPPTAAQLLARGQRPSASNAMHLLINRDLSPTPLRLPQGANPTRPVVYNRARMLARGRQLPHLVSQPTASSGRSATPHVVPVPVTYYFSPDNGTPHIANSYLLSSNLTRITTGHPF